MITCLAFAAAAPATPRAPRPLIVVPPQRADATGVTLYLHGLCGSPHRGCAALRDAAGAHGWLLGPTAPADLPGCGPSWSASPRQRGATLAGALQHARDAPGARVLVGFSQGAFTAVSVLRATTARWTAVALVGADVHLDARTVRRAGVLRVALAAGRYDPAARSMRETAAALRREGVDARFVSLGDVGHTPASRGVGPVWRDVLGWLHTGDQPANTSSRTPSS
ncbi:MAG: hypothetical protein U0325_04670 [Polyangiales bacterium]